MKHLIKSILLLLALLLPAMANAHDFEVDGIYYNISYGNNATVTYRGSSYNEYSEEYTGVVIIPTVVTFNGTSYSVTSIGNNAFEDCNGLTSVTIPNSVTSIGEAAFEWCDCLNNIEIPNSVTSIGKSAFAYCRGLTSINIPNYVTSINSYLFTGCSGLICVTIPDYVTSIGYSAFNGCTSLTDIIIPNSVTAIKTYAFKGCKSLTSITIPESVNTIEYQAFNGCSSLDTLNYNAVSCADFNTQVDNLPFYNLNISTINIGERVRYIPARFAYSLTKLTSISISNSVSNIGENAFKGCGNVASITVESGNLKYDSRNDCNAIIETANNTLLYGCNNTIIPNSVTSIGNSAFVNCEGMKSITIPFSVTSIGDYAFQGCSALDTLYYDAISCVDFNNTTYYSTPFYNLKISTIIIGDDVQRIPAYFGKHLTYLTNVTIGNSLVSIGNGAFSESNGLTNLFISNLDTWCNLGNPFSYVEHIFLNGEEIKDLVIPNSVTSIDDCAFLGFTGLTSVTISNSVTSIGSYAFYGCNGLTGVTIPNSVTSIGSYAFYGCNGLTSVTIPNSITSIGSNSFECCSSLLYVAIGNSVTSISNYAFYGCSGLTSVTIPNSVTSIGSYAFYGCNGLTGVTIPNSVTSIGSYAFYGCNGLTSVTIPNSITSIGECAFQGCSSIDSLYYNAISCTALEYYYEYSRGPFFNLNLSTLIVGDSVQRIPAAYFAYLANLTSVSIGMSVTSMDGDVFWGCNNVTDLIWNARNCNSMGNMSKSTIAHVTIGHEVETIPNDFLSESRVNEVILPNSVASIGRNAFYNCSSLTNLTIPNSVTSIGDYAFYGCSGIATLIIPNSVAAIGDCAFSRCSGLDNIYVANDNPIYDSRDNCNAIIRRDNNTLLFGCKNTVIPNSVTSIASNAFLECQRLTCIEITPSVKFIGNNAFYGCSGLTELIWNAKNCDSMGNMPKSNIAHVTIGSEVETIPSYFVSESKINEIIIPNSVMTIGDYAFYNCLGLANLTIGDSVNSIGNYAFYGCSSLIGTLRLPSTIISIGNKAFGSVPSIETVSCAATTPPSWNDIAMFTTNVYNHSPLYVPLESVREYQADQCWGQFATILGMQENVLASSISLNQSQMSLTVGNSSQLIATVLPDSTTNKVITWASSSPDVVTVTENGLVTALASGIATITATTTDGSNLSSSCEVTVIEDISNYDNYLSISDIESFHGDTIVIPVTMTNAQSILSFQTDIYLPEGLEVVQDDGEYVIDPSERMTRTHSIMSNAISNGAIRVLCYSSNYKPFTGNSGDDLFYITVKVADDAEGDYSISLRNTLFTTSNFEEVAGPDVTANLHVNSYLLGDANGSGTVTVTDVVVTSQYVLELNPHPFVFEAADVNADNNITVTDVTRIAWMVLNPTLNMPMRASAIYDNSDRMSGNGIILMPGETSTVSILLDNDMDYSAFQFDLNLPTGLTATNFQLTDRTGNHTFDVNALSNGKMRVLCYSPTLEVINGHNGALLTFDVTANSAVEGVIDVDGIELVTSACQTVKLNGFAIGVNTVSSVNEFANGKTVARVDYFNMAGQQIDHPDSGVTLVVTTYTDGTRTTHKIIR